MDTDIQKNAEQPKDEGSAIDKFNSGEERDIAYAALEREFTRKSQILKDLERENEELRSSIPQRDEIGEEVDEFVTQFPDAIELSEDIAAELEAHPDWEGADALLRAYAAVLSSKQKNAEQLKNDEEFILQAINTNPSVKEKIINDYFDEMPQSVRLPSGQGIPAMPYNAPQNIEEAGRILEEILRGR